MTPRQLILCTILLTLLSMVFTLAVQSIAA